MNFHPNAFERRWNCHTGTWMDEKTFLEVKRIKDSYDEGTYEGDAQAAIEALIDQAHAVGNAGCKGRSMAWWIMTVCHKMEWYDPNALDGDTKDHIFNRVLKMMFSENTTSTDRREEV